MRSTCGRKAAIRQRGGYSPTQKGEKHEATQKGEKHEATQKGEVTEEGEAKEI